MYERVALSYVAGVVVGILVLAGETIAGSPQEQATALPLVQQWQGDYPVSELGRLPESQRRSPVGYLGDEATFASVWRAFEPGTPLPEVDFRRHIVLFARNVDFYNSTFIAKASLEDGVVEVLAVETMSSKPIENEVAMALAVVPRAGVQYLQVGEKRIPVVSGASTPAAGDPLNASYAIEDRDVRLTAGRAEWPAAPGSTTMVTTVVFGEPRYGDLDGDGDEDAAVLLLQQPGGSGAFYYVAGALQDRGTYRGTNAVLLGDRIAPQTLAIRHGVMIANYADRRPDDPKSVRPSVGTTSYLTVREGVLAAIAPLGEDEQVLAGTVTIGHEVRAFRPCTGARDLWLLGESPALEQIMRACELAQAQRTAGAPAFMTLAGRVVSRPATGFGADHEAGFLATQLVKAWPQGRCA